MKLFWKHDSRLYEAMFYYNQDVRFLLCFSGDCLARYWCMNGSSTSTPNDGVTGQLCPAGSYCSQGTPVPTACPLGKKFPINFYESRLMYFKEK